MYQNFECKCIFSTNFKQKVNIVYKNIVIKVKHKNINATRLWIPSGAHEFTPSFE
jgi:hypothetical protein